jgi:hypothetical protein
MTSPSLRRSIGLALVSVGVEVVEGWEAHPESLDGTVTLVGVAVGVLGPGVAGVLGLPGPCLTPSKLTIPR